MHSQLKRPSIRADGKSLYMTTAGLEEQTRPNLSKKLNELVATGTEVVITDPAFASLVFKYALTVN